MTRQTAAPLEHISMSVTHRLVEDLANQIRRGSVILDPPYQRGSVWTEDQRQSLIYSWLCGIPVPAIILNDRATETFRKANNLPSGDLTHLVTVVIDGRQRLETAVAFLGGDLAIPASWIEREQIKSDAQLETRSDGEYVRYPQLTRIGQRKVESRMSIAAATARVATVAEEAAIFLLVNGGGTPQTDDDMANARRVAEGA